MNIGRRPCSRERTIWKADITWEEWREDGKMRMRGIEPSLCPGMGDGEARNRLRIQVSHLTKLKLLSTERKQGEEADNI